MMRSVVVTVGSPEIDDSLFIMRSNLISINKNNVTVNRIPYIKPIVEYIFVFLMNLLQFPFAFDLNKLVIRKIHRKNIDCVISSAYPKIGKLDIVIRKASSMDVPLKFGIEK